MIKKVLFGSLTAAAAIMGTSAAAHDFFLLPERFQVDKEMPLKIQATVGSSFPKPEAAVPADRAERVTAIGPGNPKVVITGTSVNALDLRLTGTKPGVTAIAVVSKARDVEYAEDRIPLILEEYRVAPQAAAAVEALPRPRTWQVSSRRFAKTFVCVQACRDRTAVERPFGAHLEFVGLTSSATHFRLLAGGRPLPNYPVDLVGADGKREHLATDARGDVHLPATKRGTLMLFAAKLEPPTGQERFTLDLTSLTFNRT